MLILIQLKMLYTTLILTPLPVEPNPNASTPQNTDHSLSPDWLSCPNSKEYTRRTIKQQRASFKYMSTIQSSNIFLVVKFFCVVLTVYIFLLLFGKVNDQHSLHSSRTMLMMENWGKSSLPMWWAPKYLY